MIGIVLNKFVYRVGIDIPILKEVNFPEYSSEKINIAKFISASLNELLYRTFIFKQLKKFFEFSLS
jgi:hypothetical protein